MTNDVLEVLLGLMVFLAMLALATESINPPPPPDNNIPGGWHDC